MFRNILVPTDFGPTSESAQLLAAELARKFGATLTLLHVYEVPAVPYPGGSLPSEITAQIAKAAAAELDRALLALRKRSAGATAVLREGVPWVEILQVAADVGADLIVMGTHGRGVVQHALLGSVAERVVRMASSPVLTIHAGEPAAPIEAERPTNTAAAN